VLETLVVNAHRRDHVMAAKLLAVDVNSRP